jgi:hypothetical protein
VSQRSGTGHRKDLRQPVDDLEPIELEPEASWRMVAEDRVGLMQCRRFRTPRHESHQAAPRRRRPSRRPPEVAGDHLLLSKPSGWTHAVSLKAGLDHTSAAIPWPRGRIT